MSGSECAHSLFTIRHSPFIDYSLLTIHYSLSMSGTIRIFAVLVLTLGLSAAAMSQSREPRFSDYPVRSIYKGKNVPIRLTKNDMAFRTRLRWAATHMRPNFAGHYIFTEWGCGTECRDGAVIDAKTGKVYTWDFSICCWPMDVPDSFQPIDVRLNSSLIVFTGMRNEKEGDVGKHFYKFANGKFIHIRSILGSKQP